jgi:3-phosphoshikimate 1-carboxyvinyltransferase
MIRITRDREVLNPSVMLPASKSISNRLLVLQHFYGDGLNIQNLSDSDDTILLQTLLQTVRHYHATSGPGIQRIDAHNAGTVYRFLAAVLAVTRGQYLLTGSDRMMERPVGALVDALKELGADISYTENVGFPPLFIKGRNMAGGSISIDPSLSSQFFSALALIAPALDDGLDIRITGPKASWPYADITLKILRSLGIKVFIDQDKVQIFPKEKIEATVTVEPDWSSSSFFYLLLSMSLKGEIYFPGLERSGLQGDEKVASFFSLLGIETVEIPGGIRICKTGTMQFGDPIDFSDFPDLAIPVILACAAAGKEAVFKGIDRLRIKESDRLRALQREMGKLGIELRQVSENSWTTSGSLKVPAKIRVEDDGDHRLAMAFACLAALGCTVFIEDPDVVNKSFPGFWNALEASGYRVQDDVENI